MARARDGGEPEDMADQVPTQDVYTRHVATPTGLDFAKAADLYGLAYESVQTVAGLPRGDRARPRAAERPPDRPCARRASGRRPACPATYGARCRARWTLADPEAGARSRAARPGGPTLSAGSPARVSSLG